MVTQFKSECVSLVPNSTGGWTIPLDGIIPRGDYSEEELEAEIQKLLSAGWSMVANVNKRCSDHTQGQRDLYFRRKIVIE